MGGAHSRAIAHPQQKEPVKVVQASNYGGLNVRCLGQTQDILTTSPNDAQTLTDLLDSSEVEGQF